MVFKQVSPDPVVFAVVAVRVEDPGQPVGPGANPFYHAFDLRQQGGVGRNAPQAL